MITSINCGTYALMLNAQTTKISKMILHAKPVVNNEVINCHKPKSPIDLDKVKERSKDLDFNYINLFPYEIE